MGPERIFSVGEEGRGRSFQIIGKRNVFRLDLNESREGFSVGQKGRGRSFQIIRHTRAEEVCDSLCPGRFDAAIAPAVKRVELLLTSHDYGERVEVPESQDGGAKPPEGAAGGEPYFPQRYVWYVSTHTGTQVDKTGR